MVHIETSLTISAAIGTVFDAERDVSFHIATQAGHREKAVDGVTEGLLELGDEVEWEATHLGVRQRLRIRITEMTRPFYFRDDMTKGIFTAFSHEHHFSEIDSCTTLKRDIVRFSAPFPVIGWMAELLFLKRYMKRFLQKKNHAFRDLVEKKGAS